MEAVSRNYKDYLQQHLQFMKWLFLWNFAVNFQPPWLWPMHDIKNTSPISQFWALDFDLELQVYVLHRFYYLRSTAQVLLFKEQM